MFEFRISAGTTQKLPGWEKPHAKTVAWSDDMESNAKKCVEIHKGNGRRIVQSMLTNCSEMSIFGTYW